MSLLCGIALLQSAQAEERIGLVLGGGGARGAAHIGVLKVLEREHIPIHAIAGTSVGAIIGALYSAGYSPDEIETAINSIDWQDVFDDDTERAALPMRQKEVDSGVVANFALGLGTGGLKVPTTLVKGQKLGILLRRFFLGRGNIENFDQLPIPYRCVATDIGVVKPMVFSSGDLALAVRASMAVPAVFAPVEYQGKVLVDGGIVDNVPIDVAREMGVDRLIVVDVGSPLAPADDIHSSLDVLLQMVSGLMRDRTEERLKTLTDRDVLLRPDIQITSLDFPKAMQGVAPGEQAALAALAQLRTFAVPESEYLAWQGTQRRRFEPQGNLSFVNVDNTHSNTAEYVRDHITAVPNQALNVDALEHDIRSAYGRGTYDSISYRLERDAQGNTGLNITPTDAALGRMAFRLGLQISDDFAGNDDYQLSIESRMTNLSDKGAEWRSFIGLGRVTTFATDFYVPFGARGDWFVQPEIGYTALNQPLSPRSLNLTNYPSDVTLAQYRIQSWLGDLRVGHDIKDQLRLSTSLLRGHDRATRRIASPDLFESALEVNIGGINGTLLWDTLDNVRFPTHGTRAELSFTKYTTRLGSDNSGDLTRFAIDSAFTGGRNTLMLSARATLAKTPVGAYQTGSSLGGLTYLSGLGDRELFGDQMVLLRAIYYRRLTERSLIFDLPLYLAGSMEAGNVFEQYDQIRFKKLIGAGSIFLGVNLPIGPLQFGYGHTFDGRSAVYLTFGSLVLPRYR